MNNIQLAMLVGKVICLIFSIAYTYGNIGRVAYGEPVSRWQIYIMSTSITGFITLQWLI